MTQTADQDVMKVVSPVSVVKTESVERFLRRPVSGQSDKSIPAERRCAWKRTMDIALVLVSVPLWVPVVALITLAIRIDSKGPAMYRQQRYGQGGQVFTILKFRTMRIGADEELDAHLAACGLRSAEWALTAKLREDPRQTRVGRILRRMSLDELPQVVNVLKGDMSLVGPRPIPVVERERYGPAFDVYARVLPGLTGLWQVSGRNDLPYTKRIELDQRYVQTCSFWGDIVLMFRTVGAVLSRRGAY